MGGPTYLFGGLRGGNFKLQASGVELRASSSDFDGDSAADSDADSDFEWELPFRVRSLLASIRISTVAATAQQLDIILYYIILYYIILYYIILYYIILYYNILYILTIILLSIMFCCYYQNLIR